ncbi:MAG TPA: DUF4160 domain-containing protein [Pirellulales bacterium]|nr:DUF4160 domain-containing protein [Pirellulales bacterium]
MPTVLRIGPYRFYFYSHESDEPPHVHVDRDQCTAKFWLQPISVAVNHGFAGVELRRIRRIATEHQSALLESWDGHFKRDG